ncbi:hypothetical protein [Maricaulis maris]|uniref:hypothetical protein n=1 Tax=Maricaulis maris TaxID=74318 RepID=UPI003B8DA354
MGWRDRIRRAVRIFRHGRPPEGLSLAGEWVGTYSYSDAAAPVPFVVRLGDVGGRLSGTSEEANTFADPSASHLHAALSGRREGWDASFTKTYDGAGGADHSLDYTGQISVCGRRIRGRWRLPVEQAGMDWSGGFSMTRRDVANER